MSAFVFVILAALCNAVMDTCETLISYNASKLNKWGFDRNVWCKPISASANFIPFTKYRFDAWHIFKSLMVVFMVLAIINYQPLISPIVDFILFGIAWNAPFNLLYNYLKK